MLRSILVPVDGTEFGEHALPMALSIARRSEAVIHLVHVHDLAPAATIEGVAIPDNLDERVQREEQAYLAGLTQRIAQARPVVMKTALLLGEPVSALRAYAGANSVDLVVMSTHGRGAFARFWLGSLAADLAREMPQPVLLVRPTDGEPDLRREVDLRTILLPSDGTLRCEEVFGPALELARLFGSHLDVVRVVKPALRPSYMPDGATVTGMKQGVLKEIEAAQARTVDRAEVYLDDVSDELVEGGFLVETHVVVNERPADGIEEEAVASHADLIAMETHGRRGLSRLFLGSVADKVVRGGVAPVLLHHHQPRG